MPSTPFDPLQPGGQISASEINRLQKTVDQLQNFRGNPAMTVGFSSGGMTIRDQRPVSIWAKLLSFDQDKQGYDWLEQFEQPDNTFEDGTLAATTLDENDNPKLLYPAFDPAENKFLCQGGAQPIVRLRPNETSDQWWIIGSPHPHPLQVARKDCLNQDKTACIQGADDVVAIDFANAAGTGGSGISQDLWDVFHGRTKDNHDQVEVKFLGYRSTITTYRYSCAGNTLVETPITFDVIVPAPATPSK